MISSTLTLNQTVFTHLEGDEHCTPGSSIGGGCAHNVVNAHTSDVRSQLVMFARTLSLSTKHWFSVTNPPPLK